MMNLQKTFDAIEKKIDALNELSTPIQCNKKKES